MVELTSAGRTQRIYHQGPHQTKDAVTSRRLPVDTQVFVVQFNADSGRELNATMWPNLPGQDGVAGKAALEYLDGRSQLDLVRV